MRFQRVEHFARHLAPLHSLRRVLALPEATLDRAGEDGVDVPAQPVEALRRQLVRHALQRAFDLRRRHLDQGEVAQRRQEALASEGLVVAAETRPVLLPPPLEQLRESHLRRIFGERLKAFALPLRLALQIVGIPLRIALRPARCCLLPPATSRVLPPGVVLPALLEDAGHG